MEAEERRRRGHDAKVRSDGERGERRRDGRGESEDESKEWSGRSEGDLAEETDEDGMNKEESRGGRRHADGIAMGHAGKRRGRTTGGSAGRQEQCQESPLRGRQ